MTTRLAVSCLALSAALATPAMAQDYYVPDYSAAEAAEAAAEAAEAAAIAAGEAPAQPEAVEAPAPVEFVSEPVVQEVPVTPSVYQPERHWENPAPDHRAKRVVQPRPAPAWEEEEIVEIEYVDQYGNVLGVYPADGPQPEWARPAPPREPAPRFAYSLEEREAWLAECRDRLGHDDGVGGAVIGGLLGGLAGNRIAGRGNRTVGTVAGAVVGAAAGMAIDKAEDRGRARDECLAYLEQYEAGYGQTAAYGQPGYGYGPGYVTYVPVMMVPMQMAPMHKQVRYVDKVVETVEWVDAPTRPAKRVIHKPAAKADKRVRYAK